MVDDGTCIRGGCRDSRAPEYDASASYDDGSCSPVIIGCINSAAANFRSTATLSDGSCLYVGCIGSLALNFDATATLPGLCIGVVVGCTDSIAANFYPDANRAFDAYTGTSANCIYLGCTDSTRANYDPSATTDSGDCTPIYPGCTNPTALNFNTACAWAAFMLLVLAPVSAAWPPRTCTDILTTTSWPLALGASRADPCARTPRPRMAMNATPRRYRRRRLVLDWWVRQH